MRRLLPLLLISAALSLACGGPPEPAPLPADRPANSSLSEALLGIQQGNTPASEPEGEPPEQPEREPQSPPSADVSKVVVADGDPDSPKCARAKARRDDQERRIESKRSATLVGAEDAYNRAQAAFSECAMDPSCAMDGEAVLALQKRTVSTEGALSRAMDDVGALEAELYDIDQRIRKNCGMGR